MNQLEEQITKQFKNMDKIYYREDGYLNDFHKKSTEESLEAVKSYQNTPFSLADFKKQTAMLNSKTSPSDETKIP